MVKLVQNIVVGNVYKDYNSTDASRLREDQLVSLENKCPIVNVGLEHYHGLFNETEFNDMELQGEVEKGLSKIANGFLEPLRLPHDNLIHM